MPFEVTHTLSTGRAIRITVTVSNRGAKTGVEYGDWTMLGKPTQAERDETWAMIDKIMGEVGLDTSERPSGLQFRFAKERMN